MLKIINDKITCLEPDGSELVIYIYIYSTEVLKSYLLVVLNNRASLHIRFTAESFKIRADAGQIRLGDWFDHHNNVKHKSVGTRNCYNLVSLLTHTVLYWTEEDELKDILFA